MSVCRDNVRETNFEYMFCCSVTWAHSTWRCQWRWLRDKDERFMYMLTEQAQLRFIPTISCQTSLLDMGLRPRGGRVASSACAASSDVQGPKESDNSTVCYTTKQRFNILCSTASVPISLSPRPYPSHLHLIPRTILLSRFYLCRCTSRILTSTCWASFKFQIPGAQSSQQTLLFARGLERHGMFSISQSSLQAIRTSSATQQLH